MSAQTITAAPETTARLPWRPLLLLSGAAFASVTAELLPASLLVEIGGGLGVGESAAGLLVAAWALTVAVASLPLARLTRRVPPARLIPLTLLVFALAVAATAAAPGYGAALAGRMVAAAAHGLFWSLLMPTAAAIAPPRLTGRAISVVSAGPTLAGIVGIPLGVVIGAAVGWRAAFALIAVVLVGAAVAVRALRLPSAPAAAPSPGGRGGRAVLAVTAGTGVLLVGHFLVYTYISPLLAGAGYPAGVRAALLFLFGLGGLAGTFAAGPLSDRFPRHALAWSAGVFAAVLAALALLGAGTAVAVAVLAAWGALIGLFPPVFQTRLMRVAVPGRETAAGAIAVTVLNLGIAAGAATGGAAVDRWGTAVLPALGTAAALIATALLAAAARTR
ncbi:MFS transporter [Catellatospora sp. TT07R-123]|uniref:MFS transporter n=1 Tax=Catellatospora sp. TT07R-123 TaxID=2733863 RepID=UPI001B1CF396|nr:MFS transporter [Catellatospora sp. TT07R-123]GHJ49297.1 MFS transporter [Catellatospora sp. TT07R-123]